MHGKNFIVEKFAVRASGVVLQCGRNNTILSLQIHTHPSQVEKKFGK
jgi:hypothetical protein